MVKRSFKFQKNTKGEWSLILPEWTGDPEDLQMVEGADLWLEMIGKGHKDIDVTISNEPFDHAEVLTLLRTKEENFGGGGIYYLEQYQGNKVGLTLWLCHVTAFIFGTIPQKIYFFKAVIR